MKETLRSVALAAVLGLAVSYVLWGRNTSDARPPDEPGTGVQSVTEAPRPNQPARRSKLTIEPRLVDLDTVRVDTHHEIVFTIHNPTNEAIEVTKVSSGCACVAAKVDPPFIQPGEHRSLRVKYSAKRGKMEDKVLIRLITDEPNKAWVEAHVHAKIYHEVIVEPRALNFGTVTPGDSKTATFTVRHAKGMPFEIRTINHRTKAFEFSWKPKVEGDRSEYLVTAKCNTKQFAINIKETCHILTDLKAKDARAIPFDVIVIIRGNYSLKPPAFLTVATLEGGTKAPLKLAIGRYQPGDMELESIRDMAGRPVSYTSERVGSQIQVEIKFKVPLPPHETTAGNFLVQMKGEKHPLRVPYRVAPLPRKTPKKQSPSGKTGAVKRSPRAAGF